MATAEELLNSLNDTETYSDDPGIFVINDEDRTITVPSNERLFGVTGDKDVERKYFQCPKIVGDNIDLSQHQIYISYVFTTTENNTIFPTIGNGRYHCEDVEVSGDNITFSWLLSGNVLSNPGFIAFKVMAMKNEGEELKTKWNTAPAFGTVLITVQDGEDIAEKYPDVINQIFERLDALEAGGGSGTGGTTNYENLSNKPQINGVTLSGNKTSGDLNLQPALNISDKTGSDTSYTQEVKRDATTNKLLVPASGGTVDPEQIEQAVNSYLEENPVSGMTAEQEQQLNQNTTDVADLKSAINQKKLPEGGTTGQVLTKKSDADYDAEWVTIASLTEPEENNYELVGTTPLQIDDGSWFVKPEVETVISNSESFSEGVVKNIAEDASPYELSEFITSLEVEQNKNKIKLISYKANSNIQPFYYIWFPTEVGKKYTFFVTTDSGRSNQYIYGYIFPAENVSDVSQRVDHSYTLVDSGKGFTFESSKNYAGFSYAPWNDTSEHTNTYYLFEGEYQSIPEGGSNITLTVQPGEKKVLSAFSGTILYANPETKVYKNVDGVNESPKETIICFGDSIMQLCKIPEYINEKYETDMYNLGVSGATVSYRGESSDGNNAYDFVNIVDSLGNNDLSIQIEKGQNQNFESLLGLMSKANILIVEYGTNDFQGMKSLTGEENTTVEGAYNYCLNKLSQLYPYKKIIVLSTLGYTLVGDDNGNYDILQLKEKVKEICDTLHFPFVDMMTLSNITDSNKTVFLEDGVHPKTENGRKRYGDALYYALKTIIGV